MKDESSLIEQSGWSSSGPLCLHCYTLFSATSSLKALLSDEGIIYTWPRSRDSHRAVGFTGICVLCEPMSHGVLRLRAVLGAASQTIESFRNLDGDSSLIPDPEYPVNALRIRDLEAFDPWYGHEHDHPHLLAVPGLLGGICTQQNL
jgi:hypothetical protein